MRIFETEEALVKACLDCNPAAQRALYDKHVQAMYNTVFRYTCDHHDTQDILQNGFTKVFKYLKNYDKEKGDLLSWVRKVHIRCALDFIKREQHFFENIDGSMLAISAKPIAYEEMDVQFIMKLISELPTRDRAIFNMHQIEGYSHEEISEMLSININSSRVYLARARKILREKIMTFQRPLKLVQ